MKLKLGMCYNCLIEKLGLRIKQFRDCDRLIGAVAALLNEGAIEVRNVAKVGLLQLRNAFGGSLTRELE